MVRERVCDLMAEILQRDVALDLTLDAQGGVEPLDVARFVILAEQTFGVTILDEQAAQWQTLVDAAEAIEGLIESGEAGKTIREEDERAGWYYA